MIISVDSQWKNRHFSCDTWSTFTFSSVCRCQISAILKLPHILNPTTHLQSNCLILWPTLRCWQKDVYRHILLALGQFLLALIPGVNAIQYAHTGLWGWDVGAHLSHHTDKSNLANVGALTPHIGPSDYHCSPAVTLKGGREKRIITVT